MKNNFVRALAVAAISFVAGACVAPVPTFEDPLQGIEIKPENLSFIRVGETTRDDVKAHFGVPSSIYCGSPPVLATNLSAYEWDYRVDYDLVCAVPGAMGKCDEGDIVLSHHLLLIAFDDAGKVMAYELTTRSSLIGPNHSDFICDWRVRQDLN